MTRESSAQHEKIVARTQVVATWARAERARQTVVTPEPFEELSASTTAGFARAMKRYAAFIGKPVVVEHSIP